MVAFRCTDRQYASFRVHAWMIFDRFVVDNHEIMIDKPESVLQSLNSNLYYMMRFIHSLVSAAVCWLRSIKVKDDDDVDDVVCVDNAFVAVIATQTRFDRIQYVCICVCIYFFH